MDRRLPRAASIGGMRGMGSAHAALPGSCSLPAWRAALRCALQVARLARKLPQGDLRVMALQLGGGGGGDSAVPVDEAGEEDLT